MGFIFRLGQPCSVPISNACKVLKQMPSEQLFLETDDRAISISTIFAAASSQLNVSMDDLKQQCYRNFEAIFMTNIQYTVTQV